MMRKLLSIFLFVLLLGACSNAEQSEDTAQTDKVSDSASPEMSMEMEQSEQETNELATNENSSSMEEQSDSSENENIPNVENRKIIHNAHMQLETEHFSNTTNFLEEKVESFQGYIVSSNHSTRGEKEGRFGSMTIRVPSDTFHEFITIIEDGDVKITDRSITGEDVTEQYVDLNSRLDAKKVVEERLLSFMEDAEKTEDLLEISSDLAKIQEEIEQLTGKLNYLENQSDFATVTVEIEEKSIEVPSVQDESLNTWEKTKDQLLTSIQFILSVLSSIFVFLIGNAPIFILLGLIGLVVFLIIKKRKKNS